MLTCIIDIRILTLFFLSSSSSFFTLLLPLLLLAVDITVPIRPFISQSLQISPGISRALSRPKNGEKLDRSDTVWYDDVTMSDEGAFNDGFWGQEAGGVYNPATGYVGNYMEDAISVDTYLDVTHFEQHHVYRLVWKPGNTPPTRPPPPPPHTYTHTYIHTYISA